MSRFPSVLFVSLFVLFAWPSFAQVSQLDAQSQKHTLQQSAIQRTTTQSSQQVQLRQLSQLAEYVGADYASAVNQGKIKNTR